MVTPLLRAIRLLRTEQGSLGQTKFHYFGRQSKHVIDEAHRMGVDEMVVDHGRVARAEALAAIKGAGAVAVVTSVLDGDAMDVRGIVTGKVFEALGLGAAILLVAPEGSDAATIVEGASAGRRYSAGDVEGMASFLIAVRDRSWSRDGIGAKSCEWSSLARGLDERLREVISGRTGTEDASEFGTPLTSAEDLRSGRGLFGKC